MSVNALIVINEAALLVGDPAMSRVRQDMWRVILNQSARDVARKLRLVLWTSLFDIEVADEYALPADCFQIKQVRFNGSPAVDPDGWFEVKEMFEDEFRTATNGSFASGTPRRYFPLVSTFHLYPRPDSAVALGGKITYWGLPDDVTNEATQGIPLMDIVRDSLRDRMLVYGFRRLEKWDAASEQDKEWQASLTFDRDRIEDRSADRRSRLRPSQRQYGEL